jgi:predicted dienelactone hydrolase
MHIRKDLFQGCFYDNIGKYLHMEMRMDWIKQAFTATVLLVAALGSSLLAGAAEAANAVGFQLVQMPDGAGGKFPAAVWYPTTAAPRKVSLPGQMPMLVAPDGAVAGSGLPLVVISHGNGGGATSHVDLAIALAAAGYVVAAPMHPGDNYQDQGAAGSLNWLADRSRQLHAATDYMLAAWPQHEHVDPGRVGAYGFSAGGFTVLVAVGARPNLALIAEHCARQPEFVCQLLGQIKSPLLQTGVTIPSPQPDPRIRAAVVAAPGFGFTMAGPALAGVKAPVQLWDAAEDGNVEYATNTRVVREGLGQLAEVHSVAGARHLSFLAPCPGGPPVLCADAAGFDRKAFHASMNTSVIDFFNRQLAVPRAQGG